MFEQKGENTPPDRGRSPGPSGISVGMAPLLYSKHLLVYDIAYSSSLSYISYICPSQFSYLSAQSHDPIAIPQLLALLATLSTCHLLDYNSFLVVVANIASSTARVSLSFSFASPAFQGSDHLCSNRKGRPGRVEKRT